MKQGWSVKKLHREILLSATYQQASERATRLSGSRFVPDAEYRLKLEGSGSTTVAASSRSRMAP